ncbi:MAG: S41 family peptidase [Myxococcota bacterium]|nr:S41 family peptidase [Myxococcota bacterium]
MIGAAVSPALATPERASPYRNLGTLARALVHVEAAWVGTPDQDRLIRGALDGLAASLDPHSDYLDPEEYRMLEADARGQFGGVGLEIESRDGWLVVLGVFEGAPAARAGLLPGDRLLRIDGVDARDMRLVDAVRRMRGAPGTSVRVVVRRPGQEAAIERTLVREIVRVPSVRSRLLSDRTLYLDVSTFQESTAREVRDALDRALNQASRAGGLRGILLDLRSNGGGLLDQAVLVADEFLGAGPVVRVHGRGGRAIAEHVSRDAGTRPDWPLVVLVDGYTASAAEILAGALRDHGRAVLVGRRTWGKGSVQNVIPLPDGGALKLTVALYRTPTGRVIQARGIEPDVVLDAVAAPDPFVQTSEQALDGHLEPEPGLERPRPALRVPPPDPDADGASAAAFPDDAGARAAHRILRAILAARGP